MDGVHDLGGMHGFGPVVTDGGDETHHEPWELRAQLITLLAGSSMRSSIERLDPATYLASSYYERWLRAGEMKLTETGRVDSRDLERWRARLADDPDLPIPASSDPTGVELVRAMRSTEFGPTPDALHRVGDPVRVVRMRPDTHHRCPRYVRGAVGTVERLIGSDTVPGLPAGERVTEPVYTVEFSSVDLFGDRSPTGEVPYSVLIDLWEHSLEAAR